MSRLLAVRDDDRDIPDNACWWRLRLAPNAEGWTSVIQLDRHPGWWCGYVDYFDGRNDWSWPFGIAHHDEYPEDELIGRRPIRIYPAVHYLDILDVVPPHLGWYRLTRDKHYNAKGDLRVLGRPWQI